MLLDNLWMALIRKLGGRSNYIQVPSRAMDLWRESPLAAPGRVHWCLSSTVFFFSPQTEVDSYEHAGRRTRESPIQNDHVRSRSGVSWHQDRLWYEELLFNPYRPTAIQELLEIIGRVRLWPSCSFATALDSDINQTTGSGGHLSMWENRCMHACCVQAIREAPATRRNSVNSWVNSRWSPATQPVLRGYTASKKLHCITLTDRQPFKNCWKLSVESVYVLRARSRPLSTRI